MPRTRKAEGACVYCGATTRLTRDHIPPKNLFAKPRPQLYTVPCCLKCNAGASKDDEYFRLVLTLREGSGDHPDARASRNAVLRSLARAEYAGLRLALAKSTWKVERRSESGLYLGPGLGYSVDMARVERVVARIVRGMFYRDNGRSLSQECEVCVYYENGLRNLDAASREKFHRVLIAPSLAKPAEEFGNGVMRYWSTYASDDPNVSGWAFEFYDHVRFYSLTIKGADAASA